MSVSGNSVGIDYHEKALQVCITATSGEVLLNRSVSNDVERIANILEKYSPISSVAAEACTGSANFLDELHKRTGYPVKLCHPGYAKRMKSNPDKTDFSDSALLSDLNRVGYLPEVWLAPESIRDLRGLVRYRQQVVQQGKDTKLRIRAILRHYRIRIPEGISLWSKRGVQWLSDLDCLPGHTSWILSEHISELQMCASKSKSCEHRFRVVSQSDPLVQQLMLHDGIGLITAVVIRAEVGWFSRFRTGKQLSRFCGVSPRNASSGSKQADAGLIRAGNPILKTVIIEAAHRIGRHDERWRQFGLRLKKGGKKGSVVAAAIANRWVRKLHATMVSSERFLQ